MTSSTEVAAPAAAGVPALVQTPATTITAEDVSLPRIYLGQFTSQAVKDGLVKPGSVYSAVGKDDADPQVLAAPKNKQGVVEDDGPTLYVLGLIKGWSYSEPGEELETWAFEDQTHHPDAWVTYTYSIAIPDIETEFPYKWLLTKTARPTARAINTALMKHSTQGPPWEIAFRLFTQFRENAKGEWYVPRIKPVEANPDHVAVAANLATMISSTNRADVQATGDEPAI